MGKYHAGRQAIKREASIPHVVVGALAAASKREKPCKHWGGYV
jgi:hypothetical protein